jgi:hypothetical protein
MELLWSYYGVTMELLWSYLDFIKGESLANWIVPTKPGQILNRKCIRTAAQMGGRSTSGTAVIICDDRCRYGAYTILCAARYHGEH